MWTLYHAATALAGYMCGRPKGYTNVASPWHPHRALPIRVANSATERDEAQLPLPVSSVGCTSLRQGCSRAKTGMCVSFVRQREARGLTYKLAA